MGGASDEIFAPEQLDTLLPEIQNYDLLFITSQECSIKRMTKRVGKLELYLREKGFENIDH